MLRRRRRFKSRSALIQRKHVFVLVFLVFLFFTIQSFIYIEGNLRPHLLTIAKIRITQVATEVINSAITDSIAAETNINQLIEWRTDSNDKITGFMLNYAEHMRITSEAVRIVQTTLNEAVEKTHHIPVGEALDSAILTSFGPTIPIRFVPDGAVKVDINTRQSDAGINMVLVEVYIRIMTEVAVIIPFHTDTEIVETEIPISYLMVVGDVPMYYFDSKGNPVGDSPGGPPSISIPGEIPQQISR